VRPADEEFRAAIARGDSLVLVKGARQVGKTSLLARGLQQARQAGAKVVLTDFQNLSAAYLESIEKFMLALAKSSADQLDLDVYPNRIWDADLSPGVNLERYLRRGVLQQIAAPIVAQRGLDGRRFGARCQDALPTLRRLPGETSTMSATQTSFSTSFYIIGGTVRRDAPCYVQRRADTALCGDRKKRGRCASNFPYP